MLVLVSALLRSGWCIRLCIRTEMDYASDSFPSYSYRSSLEVPRTTQSREHNVFHFALTRELPQTILISHPPRLASEILS